MSLPVAPSSPSVFIPLDSDDALIDLAAGKPAQASSLIEKYSSLGASGVLTGEPAKPFGFHTRCEENPWWKVNLLGCYPLDRIVIRNRTDMAQERAYSLRIEISINDQDWSPLHARPTSFGDGISQAPLVLELAGSVTAQFVRLSLAGNEFFHLSQVEVFSRLGTIKEIEKKLPIPLRQNHPSQEGAVRVAVLGTSNSIMEWGYTYLLPSPKLTVTTNVSLGSSHAPMLIYRLPLLEEKEFDILIVDLAVNEQFADYGNIRNPDNLENIFIYLLTWCARKKVIPVILIMPDRRGVAQLPGDAQAGKIREHLRALCHQYQIPLFDGYELIATLAQTWRRPATSFFRDTHHLSRFSAQILGILLSDLILEKVSQKMVTLREIESPGFEYFSLADKVPETDVIERKTSLAVGQFIRLKPGSTLRLTVPSTCEVVAIALNMLQTNGSLVIAGAKTLIKRLDSRYFNPNYRPSPLILVVWALLNPVPVTNGILELSCRPVEENEEAEMNDHSDGGPVSYDQHEPVIEVTGLVLRLPPTRQSAVTLPEAKLDLVKLCRLEKFAPLLSKPVSD